MTLTGHGNLGCLWLGEFLLEEVTMRNCLLASMCGASVAERIIGLLRPREVVLTSGWMWAGLFLESWMPDDIELLVVYDQLEAVNEALETLGWHLEVSSMATTNSSGAVLCGVRVREVGVDGSRRSRS